jgi:hypothetical protein
MYPEEDMAGEVLPNPTPAPVVYTRAPSPGPLRYSKGAKRPVITDAKVTGNVTLGKPTQIQVNEGRKEKGKAIMRHTLRCMVALSLMAHVAMAEDANAGDPQKQFQGPVKVFILAGQSNMQGQGIVSSLAEMKEEKPGTLATMLKDPPKGPLLKSWVNAKGEWAEGRDDVWVYDVSERGSRYGRLEFGYGWNLGSRMWFGPEMQFGHVLGDHFDN